MKVALLTGGQPRFTECFIRLMQQLEGFESADIYMCLWSSPWATDNEHARSKIEKILDPRYRLAKVIIQDQPYFELPSHKLVHAPAQPENHRWWFERRCAMWKSLQLAFDLIPDIYDVVIRFRLDGYLSRNLDVSGLDFSKNKLIFPDWPCAGWDWAPVNDQFALGSYQGMKIYTDLGNKFSEFMVKSDPNWESNVHGNWSNEHVLGFYLKENKIPIVTGDFSHHLAGAFRSEIAGRSKYTDKHYHLGILRDPTE